MDTTRKSKQMGFTLVEILVVLALVMILAAISFAVFSRVQERGRSASCQSNLKQIALAVQQYVQDNNGRYPHNMYEVDKNTPSAKFVHWNQVLDLYVKDPEIFRCPSSKDVELLDSGVISTNGRLIKRRDTSYAYEYMQVNDVPDHFDNSPTSTQMKGSLESKIVAASTTRLNHDQPLAERVYDDGSITLIDPEQITSSCGGLVSSSNNIHFGGANYSFVDGHVKWLTPYQLGEMDCASKTQ